MLLKNMLQIYYDIIAKKIAMEIWKYKMTLVKYP